jgi:hypothetical protein
MPSRDNLDNIPTDTTRNTKECFNYFLKKFISKLLKERMHFSRVVSDDQRANLVRKYHNNTDRSPSARRSLGLIDRKEGLGKYSFPTMSQRNRKFGPARNKLPLNCELTGNATLFRCLKS